MKKTKIMIILAAAVIAGITASGHAWATPSSEFNEADNGVSDDWGIYRTRSFGDDGFYQLSETSFRPVIAFESLGEEADRAYELGQQAREEYPDEFERAEAIFEFVRDRVQYTSDIDLFGYEEFARNADEIADEITEDGISHGDCEDSAVLLAVMNRGAGLRSAIALGDGHTASLVYLPGYDKATAVFEIDGESGWIWAEATGSNNPLGWVPKEYINAEIVVYEIGDETVDSNPPPEEPATAIAPGTSGGGTSYTPSPFLLVLLFFFLISRRRRRVS